MGLGKIIYYVTKKPHTGLSEAPSSMLKINYLPKVQLQMNKTRKAGWLGQGIGWEKEKKSC